MMPFSFITREWPSRCWPEVSLLSWTTGPSVRRRGCSKDNNVNQRWPRLEILLDCFCISHTAFGTSVFDVEIDSNQNRPVPCTYRPQPWRQVFEWRIGH